MTAAQIVARAGWGALAERWDTSGAEWNKPVAGRLVELAGIGPDMLVLDAGCGAGAVSLAAARVMAPGGRVVGIDSSEEMIRRARAEAAGAGLGNITFACQDAEKLTYAEGSFDVVVASMLVSYLPDPARTLRGWRRVLCKGGTLAFSWVASEDPPWVAVFDTADHYIAEPANRWRAGRPKRDIPEAEALVPSDMAVRTITGPVTTTYQNARHFWESTWSQAPGRHWANIPLPLRTSALEAVTAALTGMKAADGTLQRTRLVGYTVARLEA